MTPHSPRASSLLVILALVACGLPRDPEGTLDRVRGGTMRVGMVVDTPWVTDSAGGAGGIERRIVDDVARQVGARQLQWHRGTAADMLEALHERDLDLVIGGLKATSPWAQQVALTKPYYTDTTMVRGKRKEEPHVVAVAPGENAWHVQVERVLRADRNAFPELRHARPQ